MIISQPLYIPVKTMLFKTLRAQNLLLLPVLVGAFAFQAFAHESHLRGGTAHIFNSGENIRVSVLDENDLTRDYKIDDTGSIMMPLLGLVHVSGMNAPEIETLLRTSLQNGYILDPVISVYSLQKNSFYILGEVKKPGHYDMPKNNINILNAVALAGGFTRRANKNKFEILRDDDQEKQHSKNNTISTELLSEDIIIVKGRFFY